MKKTWTFDENEIIATAKALGIKLTNAELGSEICEAIGQSRALGQSVLLRWPYGRMQGRHRGGERLRDLRGTP